MSKLPRLSAREKRHRSALPFCVLIDDMAATLARDREAELLKDGTYHAAKILHPKILKSILRDAGLTVEELSKLM